MTSSLFSWLWFRHGRSEVYGGRWFMLGPHVVLDIRDTGYDESRVPVTHARIGRVRLSWRHSRTSPDRCPRTECKAHRGEGRSSPPPVDEIVKAADLAQALEPFVRASHFYTADTNNDYTLRVKGEDIRRARAALGWDDE